LNSQLKFIAKSNIQDYFYALILDEDLDSMKPLIEYILYHLISKEGFEEDIAQIFVLPMAKEEESLKITEFGSLIAGLNPNTEDILRSVREEASVAPNGKLLSINEINKVA
jgi:hypothetical protein